MVKGKFGTTSKSLKILWNWLLVWNSCGNAQFQSFVRFTRNFAEIAFLQNFSTRKLWETTLFNAVISRKNGIPSCFILPYYFQKSFELFQQMHVHHINEAISLFRRKHNRKWEQLKNYLKLRKRGREIYNKT